MLWYYHGDDTMMMTLRGYYGSLKYTWTEINVLWYFHGTSNNAMV